MIELKKGQGEEGKKKGSRVNEWKDRRTIVSVIMTKNYSLFSYMHTEKQMLFTS